MCGAVITVAVKKMFVNC